MLLEMKNLCKSYGETIALDRLNLQLTPGIYGLLGPNGAGKSTLMKLICMLIQPTDGFVLFDGEDIRMHRSNFLDRLGYMPQHSCLYPDFTVQEYLYYVGALKGMHKKDVTFRTEELLLRTRLMDMKKDKIQTLSGGMQQRLMFAQALLNDPEILILDEPINGLDPIGIAEVRSFIRELCDTKGKTILISSHILSEISLLADDIGIIDHGALLEEESLAELEQKSSKHIRFTLSDTAQAARILERTFHESHFSIQDDHNLRLHNLDLSVGKIVTAFVENGLEVSEAHTCEESLEDYFKRVTGGEGIA